MGKMMFDPSKSQLDKERSLQPRKSILRRCSLHLHMRVYVISKRKAVYKYFRLSEHTCLFQHLKIQSSPKPVDF